MGEHRIRPLLNREDRNRFCRRILRDVKALEVMLEEGLFERGIHRIGAEQELCLIQPDFSPAMTGPEILSQIDAPAYTSELARYNLEINLSPWELQPDTLAGIHRELKELLALGDRVSQHWNSRIILAGILPTIERRHLQPKYMTPAQRYQMLSEKMLAIRGEDFKIQIEGVDELIAALDSVLFEACNTSFQLHLQIDPDDFVTRYNWSQMIAGPVMAIAANSPLLLGRELWMETRIALFKQSLDTRNPRHQLRDKTPRVNFGNDWIQHSVADLFKENIARFPMLLGSDDREEDSLDSLERAQTPKLRALQLHNGTTYTWNRPCYGVGQGRPHLRIECRYLPAGPSVLDEMANFAFWVGLMKGMPESYRNLKDRADFRVAKSNFFRAARTGMATGLEWEGKLWAAPQLVSEKLLPIAEMGLATCGIAAESIGHYLGVIHDRCVRERSGARWMVRNFQKLRKTYGRGMATSLITEAMVNYQADDRPVHTWPDLQSNRIYPRAFPDLCAKDIMSTDLFTVNEEDPVQLTEQIMRWRNIRHLPVENDKGELIGILSRRLLEAWTQQGGDGCATIDQVMVREPICAGPNARLEHIRRLMLDRSIGCVPIIVENRLVGMITDTDMQRVLAQNDEGIDFDDPL